MFRIFTNVLIILQRNGKRKQILFEKTAVCHYNRVIYISACYACNIPVREGGRYL